MPEVLEQPSVVKISGSPFIEEGAAPVVEQPKPEPAAAVVETPAPEVNEEILTEEDWIKDLGFTTKEEIKAAKQRLQELEKPTSFANEESEKLYKAWVEGKKDDVLGYLEKQRQLDKVEKLDVSNYQNAANIVKTAMQYKNPDLNADEIDFLFDKKFNIPEKPKSTDFDSDEDFQASLKTWERTASIIEKELTIEAKMSKPELTKYKAELSLPEISKPEPTAYQPTQEELQQAETARKTYLDSIEPGLKAFSGFNTVAKVGDVEIPVTYGITENEKKALASDLQSFDHNEYLQKRWLTEDGKFSLTKIAQDKYTLDNLDKILAKNANEAIAKWEAHRLKTASNISLDGKTKVTMEQPQDLRQAEIAHIMKEG